jgi:hypothetical protein
VRVLAIYELDEPHNPETVAFGSGPENYLMVMRALTFDDADVRTGMDTYCLVTGSQLTFTAVSMSSASMTDACGCHSRRKPSRHFECRPNGSSTSKATTTG